MPFLLIASYRLDSLGHSMLDRVERFKALKRLQVCTSSIRAEAVCMSHTQERVYVNTRDSFDSVIAPSDLQKLCGVVQYKAGFVESSRTHVAAFPGTFARVE